MSKRAIVRLVGGTEVDPNTFHDRCDSVLNLLRAVAIANNPETNYYDDVALDHWGVHDSLMGIITLVKSLERDLGAYFSEAAAKQLRTDRPRLSGRTCEACGQYSPVDKTRDAGTC